MRRRLGGHNDGRMAAPSASSDRLLLALVIRCGAAGGVASVNALVKAAEAGGASVGEALFFRQGVTMLVLGLAVAAGPGWAVLRTGRLRAHVVRTLSGLIGMVFLYTAVTLLPLAEATTLGLTTPIFATVLGALWLKESTGWHRWSAVALGFAGALIVAGPSGAHFAPLGSACGLLWALMTAIVAIQLRQIGRTEHPLATVFWFGALSMPVLLPVFAATVAPHPAWVWLTLGGVGLMGALTQVLLTTALRYGPVSLVVPMDYSSLLWATLFGWLLFGTLPVAATWIGAALVIASGLYIVWRERRVARRPPGGEVIG